MKSPKPRAGKVLPNADGSVLDNSSRLGGCEGTFRTSRGFTISLEVSESILLLKRRSRDSSWCSKKLPNSISLTYGLNQILCMLLIFSRRNLEKFRRSFATDEMVLLDFHRV